MVRFSPDGRPPTESDLFRAAAHDVTLHACLEMERRGDLTAQQALWAAVLALIDQNASLRQQLVEATMKQRIVYLKDTR